MPPDRTFIESALADVEGMVRFLRGQAARPIEEFLGSPEACFSTAYALVAAIEGVIGISSHLVASEGASPPAAATDIFAELSRMGVLGDPALEERLVRMVQFRNLLVHRYWTVDYRRVREIVDLHLEDFNVFAQCVMRRVESTASDG